MKRGDVVFLALSEARCAPSGYCIRKAGCARYLVAADQGRPVADFTAQHSVYSALGWCAGYMDAEKYRTPLRSSGGPRVHEAPGGLTR